MTDDPKPDAAEAGAAAAPAATPDIDPSPAGTAAEATAAPIAPASTATHLSGHFLPIPDFTQSAIQIRPIIGAI